MSSSETNSAPLAGICILDLADEKASFCSKLLADLGAEVIKIESPGGDPSRQTGPFLDAANNPEGSLSFWYHNSGKLGITLDLNQDSDRDRFLCLAGRCDVVVETFVPGYLDGIGIGYETLRAKNPGLVLASITGFGQTGPYSKYKSCDIVASASGGQMYVCGGPHKEPLKPYGFQAYYLASLFAAIGIILTLRWRRHSGRGQHIDVSLQEAVAAALEHVMLRYFQEGFVPRRQGSLHWNGSSDLFPCKDGYALLSFNREWETLVELLDRQSMAADFKRPEWLNEAYRRENIDTIQEALSFWTSMQSVEDLFKLGQSMRFPWAVLNTVEDIFKNEQLTARTYFVETEHPLVPKPFKVPRPVIDFGNTSGYCWKSAPFVGEHNEQVLNRAVDSLQVTIAGTNSDAASDSKLPLEGVRVLDFTWMLAGPYATRILADFGAEVIKVQSKKTASGAEDNTSAYFATWNRNKLSLTLDMSLPGARQLALELVEKCDVVIENFTPRVMQNWGLGYENLKHVKPDIIMVSLSGFGHSGPWRDYAALGPTIQALSGLTKLTSNDDGVPYGIGFAYADHVSGLYAALATLSALEYRAKTGEGACIDISELEAACSLLGPDLMDYSVNGNLAKPVGNKFGWQMAAPYGCYKCKGDDRWCVIAVFNHDEWQALCRLMGNPQWTGQGKFASMHARAENSDELNGLIGGWTANYAPDELVKMLQAEGVCAAVVCDARDLANDAHLAERGFFVKLTHPVLGEIRADRTPIGLSETAALFNRAAPLLGEDNRRIFLDLLGMDEKQYENHIARGVIA